MRNNNLLKTFLSFIFIFFLFVFFNQFCFSSNFTQESSISHIVSNGIINTSIEISMNSYETNPKYLNYTSIKIPFKDIQNIKIKKDNRDLLFSKIISNEITELVIDFNGVLLYQNSPEIYTISFQRDYSLQEIVTLQLLGNFSNDIELKSVSLNYHNSLGNIQSSSAEYNVINSDESNNFLQFENITESIINISIGKNLAYSFNINEIFENYDLIGQRRVVDVNLPMYNENQTIIFDKVSPIPDYSFKDEFGNLFARYIIQSNSKVSIEISGYIVPVKNKIIVSDIQPNQISTEYSKNWLFSDKNLETSIKLNILNSTNTDTLSQNILNYIINNYNPAVIQNNIQYNNDVNNSVKLKILNANDYSNISMALLSLYKIPSRQVVGYIDTGNEIIPHTWSEYYSNEWKIFDPYLQEYSDNYNNYQRIYLFERYINEFTPEYKYSSLENIKILKISKELEPRTLLKIENVDNKYILQNIGDTIITNVRTKEFSLLRYNQIILPNTSKESIKTTVVNADIATYYLYDINAGNIILNSVITSKGDNLRYLYLLIIIPIYIFIYFIYYSINLKNPMKKLKNIFRILLFLIFFSLSINTLSAQEITNTYEPFDIYITVGSQSIFTKKVPVTIKIIPNINSEETQIKWDTPLGISIEENYDNFFYADIDNSYTAKAYIIPDYKGDYEITVSVNSWRINTNLSSSETFQISFDNNLYVTPIQGGTLIQVLSLIILIFGSLFLLAFFIKKNSKIWILKFKDWIKPPQY